MSMGNGTGIATLEREVVSTSDLTPPPRAGGRRLLAIAGVLVYGLGMLAGMLWSAVSSGDWWVALLFLPQALFATAFGPGSMAMALLAPDPYVAEPGHPPAELPDFG